MPLAKIPVHESWERKHDKQADCDRIKFPALRENIAYIGFEQIGDATNEKIKRSKFKKAQPERLDRISEEDNAKQAFGKERQVGGKRRQQDYEPA